MFGDVFIAAQPIAFPRLGEASLLDRMARDFLEDEVMEAVMEPWGHDTGLVLRPRAWVKPRPHLCPLTCVVTRPRRPTRQHFVLDPRLASDAMASGDQQCGQGAPHSSNTKDKELNASSRKRTASTPSVTSKGAATDVRDTAGSSHTPTDTSESRGDSPWQFSVDMKGCDEVRATTEGGLLVVEGRGSSSTSQQLVRHITSLPRHATHDALTATLNHGRLTVTLKAATQLQGHARTLNIDVLQQKEPECTEQQQQMTPESTQQQQQQQQQQKELECTEQQQQKTPESTEHQQQEASESTQQQEKQQLLHKQAENTDTSTQKTNPNSTETQETVACRRESTEA